MRARPLSAVATLAALALMGAACGGDRETVADHARAALDATTLLSRSYVYTDVVTSGPETSVEVTIEDDFRYQAAWSVDGRHVYTEVVRDDAIAARAVDFELVMATIGASTSAGDAVPDLDALTRLGDPEPTPSETASEQPGPTATPTQADAAEAPPAGDGSAGLEAGGWVVDQIGAPTLATAATVNDLGLDPVSDAVGVLTLATTSLASAPAVGVWDQSAIEYDPDQDPFRAPDEQGDKPEVRYDVAGQAVVSRANVTGQSAGVVTPEMLRQMAIFVRDGVVTEIRIKIDTTAEASFEAIEKAYDLPTDGTDKERAARALQAVNDARADRGDAPITPRDITVTFQDVGGEQSVTLPTGTVASLADLANRGSVDGTIPIEPTEEPASPGTGGEVPTPEVADPE